MKWKRFSIIKIADLWNSNKIRYLILNFNFELNSNPNEVYKLKSLKL
jgi:hypothetical protein